MESAKEEFTRIYREHVWGGTSKSGPGSDPEMLRAYSALLVDVLKQRQVRAVVDVGCGDWALGRTLDWSGVDYTGIDIVPDVVEHLNVSFGSNRIRFRCLDIVSDELPQADLCVIKDVLQHLSNDSVRSLLGRLSKYFLAALITNDLSHQKRGNWRTLWKTESIPPNTDIREGGYRPLRLRESPFNLPARQLLTMPFRFERLVFDRPGVVYETKEVLLWEREK